MFHWLFCSRVEGGGGVCVTFSTTHAAGGVMSLKPDDETMRGSAERRPEASLIELYASDMNMSDGEEQRSTLLGKPPEL